MSKVVYSSKKYKMKTINQLKEELLSVSNEILSLQKSNNKKDHRLSKHLRNKLPELKMYFNYLESKPSKAYCENERDRITNRINEISKFYELPKEPERFTKGQLSKMKKDFETKWDIPKLRKQLAAINYILN